MRPFESIITRIGFVPFFILAVKDGLSAITVPEPVRIASYLFLNFCTCLRAFSVVIHFEDPFLVAILPSSVDAVFIAIKGLLSS